MAIDTTRAIVARLVAEGVGVDTGANTSLFHSRLPATPNTCIAVRALPGGVSDRAMGTATPPVRENPDVQLLVRGATIAATITLMDAIRAALDFKEWTASDGSLFFSRFAYEPADLGEDESQREVRSIVVDIKRTR